MADEIEDCSGRFTRETASAGMKPNCPDESVQLAFADPPFNIGYEYDEYDDRLDAEKYVDWSRQWMQEIHRVLDPNGTFWLAIGDEYAAELKVAAAESRLSHSQLGGLVLHVRRSLQKQVHAIARAPVLLRQEPAAVHVQFQCGRRAVGTAIGVWRSTCESGGPNAR